jgi:hypothetical protein
MSFVMLKCGILFEVRTGFLNIIYASLGFKGLENINLAYLKSKVKQSLYTPWRRLGGEEV